MDKLDEVLFLPSDAFFTELIDTLAFVLLVEEVVYFNSKLICPRKEQFRVIRIKIVS